MRGDNRSVWFIEDYRFGQCCCHVHSLGWLAMSSETAIGHENRLKFQRKKKEMLLRAREEREEKGSRVFVCCYDRLFWNDLEYHLKSIIRDREERSRDMLHTCCVPSNYHLASFFEDSSETLKEKRRWNSDFRVIMQACRSRRVRMFWITVGINVNSKDSNVRPGISLFLFARN